MCAPYIAHAAASVAPLHIARGVQNKVLEAMSFEKPVVATSAASRALAAEPGQDFWLADSAVDFAEATIAAAMGPERKRIAANGRRHVERHHDWARNLADLDMLLAAAADRIGAPLEVPPLVADQPRTVTFAGTV